MKTYLIYTDEDAQKFWEIDVIDNSFSLRYGRLNTTGQQKEKTFEDREAAQKEAQKQIKSKLKKGYVKLEGGLTATPTQAWNVEFCETDCGQGWAFGRPPGLTPEQWPLNRCHGVPMPHLFTVKVPEEYRVKGQEFMAIAVFQTDCERPGEIHTSPEMEAYLKQKHPMEVFMEDEINFSWVVIWLTEAEFNSRATPLPQKNDSHVDECENSVFETDQPAQNIQLKERTNDPNVGKVLCSDEDNSDYIPMFSEKGEELSLSDLFGKPHFGGTCEPGQMEPDGYSPFYIEFDDKLGGGNLGGDGTAQIDLLNDQLSWACG